MPTTVRVLDEDKKIIDRLQARYVLATGKRISLEDLMSLILETAGRHEEEILKEDRPRRLTKKQIDAFERDVSDWGVVTREAQIDETLYGDGETS